MTHLRNIARLMDQQPTFERITAQDVRPGDSIARSRKAEFRTVESIDEGPVARRFRYVSGGNDRPNRDARWWRIVREA